MTHTFLTGYLDLQRGHQRGDGHLRRFQQCGDLGHHHRRDHRARPRCLHGRGHADHDRHSPIANTDLLSNQGDSSGGGRVGFDEIAITAAPADSENDGMPDEFELAHTQPASATALLPGADLENSGAGDGLTNLQEDQLGTNPLLADTDGNGLQDGPEVAGAGNRPPTDPLNDDSDVDGLSDPVETNTGVWAGAANTGTNPVNLDTDADGLLDSVETNTGTFVNNRLDQRRPPRHRSHPSHHHRRNQRLRCWLR